MFTPDRLERLSQIEQWHFWFVGRQQLIMQLLREYVGNWDFVLDIGCGTGHLLQSLRLQGFRTVGLDRRPEGLEALKRTDVNTWLIQADACRIPLVSRRFEAAILLDVMEHVDDHALLHELHRLLKPGCVAILTTPAMAWLWSFRDDAAGHLRRYSRAQLHQKLTDTGFDVLDIRYYQFFLFPLILMTRLFGRKEPQLRDLEDMPPKILNRVFTAINLLEVRLGRFISWPWGSSIVAVCRKL
jgi:SAM-dependent methyltransferase